MLPPRKKIPKGRANKTKTAIETEKNLNGNSAFKNIFCLLLLLGLNCFSWDGQVCKKIALYGVNILGKNRNLPLNLYL